MSWSMTVSAVKAADASANLDAEQERNPALVPEMQEQLDAAKAVALALLESGAVGNDPDATYTVALSGHANPDHGKRDGWSNESVYIAVHHFS
jgi:hypothetical protein